MNSTLLSPTKKMAKKAPSRNYFTQDTEDAIVLYNNTVDFELKSKIYEDRIHYAFFKLTQNIIHTFKFYHTEVENLEHLQHEIEVFLLSKMHLFNPENGAKAYSYFGTIVKRWCILYNDKNYKKKIQKVPVTELEQDDSHSYTIEPSNSDDKLSLFIDGWVEFVSFNLYEMFSKEYDTKIADAVLELFRKRDQIDIFNKKALYIYIREMVPDAKTPKITKIADTLYDNFKHNYLFYLDQGYTNFQL
jgi:ribosome-associated toxin RatA of RatAB toxin-antitoxin module